MEDQVRYNEWMAAKDTEWENKCRHCGACCGAYDDPCENLHKGPNGRFYCGVYDHRFGQWHTVSGKVLNCVPIRTMLALGSSWPGDEHCGYKSTPDLLRSTFVSLVLLFLFAFNCFAADLTIEHGTLHRVLSKEILHQRLHLAMIEVQDPVYHKRKHYAGYWLSDVFELAGVHPRSSSVLVFSAMDGYKAPLAYADLKQSKSKAFVAIRDLDAPEGWEKIDQGKEWLSPGPFYLVWQTPHTDIPSTKLPWPYQLVEITIRDAYEAQDKLLPAGIGRTESIDRGFKIFHQNCVACHSLNLEGGTVGPELNVPRNILEYRDRKTLKEFIADPSSFRAKSKMPSFNRYLSKQSIDDVLDYLAWMGKHKKL